MLQRSRKLEPFVDADQMKAARLERAQAADLATATTLRDVKSLREMYTLAVNGVRKRSSPRWTE
jgi:hypothetical protein